MSTDAMREELARTIALSYGVDPDEDAPLATMCTHENGFVPWWKVYEEQADAIIAAGWSHTPAQQPPEPVGGWKMVPVEPTEAMLAASEREWDGRMSARSAGVWSAMLAAAPAPPADEVR